MSKKNLKAINIAKYNHIVNNDIQNIVVQNIFETK